MSVLNDRARAQTRHWAGGLGLVVALAACQAPPTRPSASPAVHVAPMQRQTVGASTRYSGSIEPWERLDLAFKVGGKVATVAEVSQSGGPRPLQEGDRVVRGQTLASLEATDFRTQVRVAAAGVSNSDAQVRGGEEALSHSAVELARAKLLYSSGAMARADLERAEAAWRSARANLDAARGQRQGRVEQHALTKSTASETALTSPIDGVVARRLIEVGSTVGPGTVAVTVMDTSSMRAVFGVPDIRIAALHIGDRVAVEVDALPAGRLSGTIVKIHPVADPVLRSFAVEVALPNADDALRAGMVASADFDVGTFADAMLVPLAAIIRPPGASTGFAVWVIDDKTRRVALRPVALGDLSGNDVLVESGLKVGDKVVTAGAPFLHAGQLVEVTQ